MMRLLTVTDSSNVAAVGYDVTTQKLRVQFKSGGEYEYSAVTPEVFAGLVGAPSIGGHFGKHIREHYPHVRVAQEK